MQWEWAGGSILFEKLASIPSIMNTTNTSLYRSSCLFARGEVLQCGDVCMAKVRLEDTFAKVLQVSQVLTRAAGGFVANSPWERCVFEDGNWGRKVHMHVCFHTSNKCNCNCLMNQQVCIVYSEICIYQLDDKCIM